ncbi:unnamed protein product, partial [Mesorhabditis spiculigera]
MNGQPVIRKPTSVNKLVEPTVCLGNLLLIDHDPFSEEAQHSNEDLLARARDSTQYLFNRIWELNKEHVDEAVVVTLPDKTYRIPREKPIPTPREPTKWEAYAKQKGIVKQKKDKKVYDEATGEWKPTWGYRSGKDNTKDWLIEVPGHKDPNADYFEERIKAKKERVAKNETQRLKNIARHNAVASKKTKGPPVDKTALGVGVDAMQRNKNELREAVDRAKVATASVGKFQDKIQGEKPNVKKGIKRKFEPNIAVMAGEKERNKSILERLAAKKPKLNAEKLAAVAPKEAIERKKTKEPPRMKSRIHKQQFYDRNIKHNKGGGGDKRKGANAKKAKGGGKGKAGK